MWTLAPFALTSILAVAAFDGSALLNASTAAFDAQHDRVVARAGFELAYDLRRRLESDKDDVAGPVPDTWAPDAWTSLLAKIDALDTDLMAQLIAGVPHPLDRTPGLYESYLISKVDGTAQPFAVYVPDGIKAGDRAALAIVLHGRPQTESELLGQRAFRDLADATHTILIAPYGRGNYDFGAPADREMYDLAEYAQRALDVDPHRLYLVGYSMGGFSVFRVGAEDRSRWTAVMCVSGAVLNSEVSRVAFAWRDTPVYVVNGARDASIPPEYGAQTASALAERGVPVSFYQAAAGTHSLRTLGTVLGAAWNDMISGAVRPDSVPARGGGPFAPNAGGTSHATEG